MRATTGGAVAKSEAELAKGIRSTVAGAIAAGAMALAPGAASAGGPGLRGQVSHERVTHERPSHIIYRTPPAGAGAAGTTIAPHTLRADKGPMISPSEKPPMPVIKNSIFKKAPEMGKGEKSANGGCIKLGKQEFYIDLANASDPKKRLKETNPVKEAVVPGGKETGWQTDGTKCKVVERSASGGAISKNPPKAGPDQKNTAENSVTEGNPGQKKAPKNDLIAKAAMNYHSRMQKAMPSMAAPKPPQAPGAGSPSLSGKPSVKPPTAAPGGKPMGGFGKALMPFSAQKEAADKAPRGMAPGAGGEIGGTSVGARPQARPTSEYDPSLYQPAGKVSSGLELAGPPKAPPGTGVTPRPAAPVRSPAVHKGIRGFLSSAIGKAEESANGGLCKMCKKMHKAGQCG